MNKASVARTRTLNAADCDAPGIERIAERLGSQTDYGAMMRWRVQRATALTCAAMLVSACNLIPDRSASRSPDRSDGTQIGADADYPRAERAPRLSQRAEDRRCLAELGAAGARFTPLPDAYAAPGCSKLGTVRLTALAGDDANFGVTNLGAVKCRTAKAFSGWVRFGVDRAAQQILGSPLEQVETMGSYSCRNIAGSNRRSAHATGDAIDVSGFLLADGRRITLSEGWDTGSRAEREFLRVVHRSACRRFGTVLGPDYNRAHENHFHLEGGSSGGKGANFCR